MRRVRGGTHRGRGGGVRGGHGTPKKKIKTGEKATPLKGKTVLITSGATREYLDDVRFISNPSSGKSGYWLAMEAAGRGANVIFVTAGGPEPEGCEIVRVISAADMLEAVMARVKKADVVIGAAAVGDFTAPRQSGKIKRESGRSVTIKLTPTVDIMARAGRIKGKRVLVGYSAESGNKIKNAVEKMKRKNLDLVVFNDISKKGLGFASDDNKITVMAKGGRSVYEARASKQELAAGIIDLIERLVKK
ncbi:MAG: hypothetical protein LLG37_00630 [Spirochaetia bacterium]|nr:hypothetical protein [Spirochaetia bacterium]